MAPSKAPTSVEIALVPLKSCLVNLPPALVSLLVNANAPAQNVIVELQYRSSLPTAGKNGISSQKLSYVGWTGMPSKRRLAPVVGRDGISGTRGVSKELDNATVELDSTFARVLGLTDGQKVGVLLHLEPPIAHTVNIEPLTPTDWEIIELHANFLELNLLSQIRALPNPAYTPVSATQVESTHPLTLHLSPTSTANIIVTSLTPPAPSASPFAKIAHDAEVIVAPKVRPKSGRPSRSENRSTTSIGRKSQGGRSTGSATRPRSSHSESSSKGVVYLRGVDRGVAVNWFDEDADGPKHEEMKIWVDPDVLAKPELRGSSWACVSIVRPMGLQTSVDPQQHAQAKELQSGPAGSISRKLVAKISSWDDSPDCHHVALSSSLSSALEFDSFVGGIVRVEAAPHPIQTSTVKTVKIFPFGTSESSKKKDGLRFGGDSTAARDAFVERLKTVYGDTGSDFGILSGPLTDGMILPKLDHEMGSLDFDGGMIRFDPPISTSAEKPTFGWILGSESKTSIEIQAAIPKPSDPSYPSTPIDELIPIDAPQLVGIDPIIDNCMSNLTRSSSILLSGGLGSGKTSLSYLLAKKLREDYLFNVTYFPCRKLLTDETRVPVIKETLQRLFLSASWCARLGGNSVVILDDLDKLCPAETELQVGSENGRSRQVSEVVCSMVREFCSASSSVVLLATAQSKEALNNVVVGGHVVREIIALKAPSKDGRRKVLEQLTKEDRSRPTEHAEMNGHARTDSSSTQGSWLDPSNPGTRPSSSDDSDGFVLSRDLDFLDLAGKTDGYMPGDLVLLVARARNEALISAVQDTTSSSSVIALGTADFDRALKGFTPASLRNVTLTSSSTTFSSIGGLHNTRLTLLETLQYPTKYAPIFAQCPLRLRSGLLLYGFPGCGKTLLASAVAGECGLNFISVKGPEILNKYIGASEKSVRDLFERAEAARPCILFFDEFDSIAPKRGHDSTGVTDRVVNQLLTQMDGAEGLSGVYVLAATSRPDLIDPALLRPGRLDKSLLCDLPNHADRIDIIQALSGKLNLSDGVISQLGEIASRTEGYSGADLQAVVYNAHLEAIHDALGDRTPTAPKGPTNQSAALTNGTKSESPPSSPSDESHSRKSPRVAKPFVQFLYDQEQHSLATSSSGGAGNKPALTPPALIAAKIEELKKTRRRQRLLEQGGAGSQPLAKAAVYGDSHHPELCNDEQDSDTDISVEWVHIERSLATTRCSISDVERKRLEGIYREFTVGRNGEMPTGEGAREVGGRTSLM
ncbi:Peroxisome biosynthesis protein pex1 [Myotisia sp. PD_48]|nr:Peroxisome biosynthesis protein pex1 [Myotisia sp. PD_48]